MSPSLAHARKHSLSAPCDTFHQPRGTGQGARNASVSVTNQHSRFYTPNSLFTQGVSVARSRGHCFAGWRRRRQPSRPPGRDRPALRVGLPKGCLTHGCSISRFNKNPSLSLSLSLYLFLSLSLARSLSSHGAHMHLVALDRRDEDNRGGAARVLVRPALHRAQPLPRFAGIHHVDAGMHLLRRRPPKQTNTPSHTQVRASA